MAHAVEVSASETSRCPFSACLIGVSWSLLGVGSTSIEKTRLLGYFSEDVWMEGKDSKLKHKSESFRRLQNDLEPEITLLLSEEGN
jgi:hypothetical protein